MGQKLFVVSLLFHMNGGAIKICIYPKIKYSKGLFRNHLASKNLQSHEPTLVIFIPYLFPSLLYPRTGQSEKVPVVEEHGCLFRTHMITLVAVNCYVVDISVPNITNASICFRGKTLNKTR